MGSVGSRMMARVDQIGIRVILCALAVAVSFSVAGCSKTDEEAEILALVQEGVKMAEAHDLNGVVDLTTDSLMVDPGAHSRGEAKRLLFVGFKRYGSFRILYPRPSITLDESKQHAEVTLHFLVANKQQVVPDLENLYDNPSQWFESLDKNADLFTLTMKLQSINGDWRVHHARLTRFAGLQGH